MDAKKAIPLLVVLGSTGTGKSSLAVHIARNAGGEIVNCDSLQVYRGFDIGTAKIPSSERCGIPHHLIDILEAHQLFTAGEYAQAARRAAGEIAARDRIPIVAGGTGFYLRALLQGLFPGPSRSEELRARLELRDRGRPGSLHRILSRLDPIAAARIHANDKNKLIRALEVRLIEGKPMSTLFQRGSEPLTGFQAIKVGLCPPRDLLYRRLDARAEAMFGPEGLVEEVTRLREAGVSRTAKPFESLGYKQALQFVEGHISREEALRSTQLETRRYAKRQITWFRKEQNVQWLTGFGDDPAVQNQALAFVIQALATASRLEQM